MREPAAVRLLRRCPVRQLADNGELSKVLVEGHQDPALAEGPGEDLLVAGVGRPVAGPDDVMAGRAKASGRAAPDAGVEEELHVPIGTRRGTMRLPVRISKGPAALPARSGFSVMP